MFLLIIADKPMDTGPHNFSTVHDFNLATFTWTAPAAATADPAGAAPRPLTGFRAAVAVGRLVVFGGVDAQGELVLVSMPGM